MSTLFILGNDFADQYQLSLLRKDNRTFLSLGDSNRNIQIEDSVSSPSLVDESGHAFQIRTLQNITTLTAKFKVHRKAKRWRRTEKDRKHNGDVRATEETVIPPETCLKVPVICTFPPGCNSMYVERMFHSNRDMEDIYAALDSLVSRDNPFLHMANFSSFPVTIQTEQIIGKAKNHSSWLD